MGLPSLVLISILLLAHIKGLGGLPNSVFFSHLFKTQQKKLKARHLLSPYACVYTWCMCLIIFSGNAKDERYCLSLFVCTNYQLDIVSVLSCLPSGLQGLAADWFTVSLLFLLSPLYKLKLMVLLCIGNTNAAFIYISSP